MRGGCGPGRRSGIDPVMPEAPDDPKWVSVEHDGLTIGALDWGGDGPPLVLLHPNGFCAGVFDPLARAAAATSTGRSRIDLRGHGTSDAPTTYEDCGFVAAAGDVVAAARRARPRGGRAGRASRWVAAPGSCVDQLRPGLVRTAAAVRGDRHAPGRRPAGGRGPRTTCRRWRAAAGRCGPTGTRSGSRTAAVRRSNVMEPDALDGYVRWGFRDRPDGQVELSCPPEVEAWFFECGTRPDGAPASFDHLASLHADVTIVCADGTDLPDGMFAAQAERAGVDLVTVSRHPLLRAGGHRARRRPSCASTSPGRAAPQSAHASAARAQS